MTETVTRPYARAFMDYAGTRPEILCLSADLTSSCEVDGFRDAHPDQFLSLGMAEQNMLSFAGGLAMHGFRPFIHTFGVFIYRRPYDQLVNSVAYSNRKVRLMSFLPGITTPGGITHQAIEDVAMMRALPNMTVIDTGDATEVETMLPAVDAVEGPVYVRVLRGQVPRLFQEPFQFNRLRLLAEGDAVLVVSSSICTEEAMRAVRALGEAGIAVRHLHASTIKPFPRAEFLDHLSVVKGGVVTIENHIVTGGLGSLVAEILAEEGAGKRLVRLGLQDTFAHGASPEYLKREYGLDAFALVQAVERMTGTATGISREDLATVQIDEAFSADKVEAL